MDCAVCKQVFHSPHLNGNFLQIPLKSTYEKFSAWSEQRGWRGVAAIVSHIVVGLIFYPLFVMLAGIAMLPKMVHGYIVHRANILKSLDLSSQWSSVNSQKTADVIGGALVRSYNRSRKEDAIAYIRDSWESPLDFSFDKAGQGAIYVYSMA